MQFVVADDHDLFREGCRLLLQQLYSDADIRECRDYKELREAVADSGDCDLMLVDILMPGLSGIEMLREIREKAPNIPLVVVSALEKPDFVRQALEIGAAGYLPKSLNRNVMQNAIIMILSGGRYFPPDLLTGYAPDLRQLQLRPDQDGGSGDNRDILTQRQRDVLRLLSLGHSNKEIASHLGLSEGTVKVHVAAIFKLLRVSSRTQAMLAAAKLDL